MTTTIPKMSALNAPMKRLVHSFGDDIFVTHVKSTKEDTLLDLSEEVCSESYNELLKGQLFMGIMI
jgi:hypothetical protein